MNLEVAFLVAAWIETVLSPGNHKVDDVAFLVDAWIETLLTLS